MKRFACIITALIVASCTPVTPGPVTPTGDDGCTLLCAASLSLRCRFGAAGLDGIEGTADDATCLQMCQHVMAQNYYRVATDCVSDSNTCEQLDQCLE